MWRIAAVISLLAVAARAQFPFTDSPLQESIHSNKVFINVTDLQGIAGVWKGVGTTVHQFLSDPDLADTINPTNLSCKGSLTGGWNYDYFDRWPRAITIEFDENAGEGLIGNYVESDTDGISGLTRWSGITEYNVANGQAILHTGDCRVWRPYFDWELGKTMMIRSYRTYIFSGDNGMLAFNLDAGCVYADGDHPQCTEGDFEIDGGSHTGISLDSPIFMECIAGPCLDLPFTLDGFVQTQGYIPFDSVGTDGK